MTTDPKDPETLLSVSTEVEAAAIVTALAEYGIEALSVGGYTSGFKAEAPGSVAVVVKLADFERAKHALTEIRAEQTEIDWSKVDVAGNLAAEPPGDEGEEAVSNWAVIPLHLWWILFLLGLAICFLVWLFTRETRFLVQVFVGIVIIGLALGLPLLAFRRR